MYDLAVLGGGPAGYLAAERAAAAGMKVALFEKRSLGGVCLNEGCIPTKALLHTAKACDYASHAQSYAVSCAGATIDHPAAVARKDRVVKTLVSGVTAKLKSLGVDIVASPAAITGRDAGGGFVVAPAGERGASSRAPSAKTSPGVNPGSADGGAISAARVLAATGSAPILPPIEGLKEALTCGSAVTSREMLDAKSVPPRLAIIGGGVIGLEMAAYFAAAGSKVTVIEALGKIGGPTEEDASSILLSNLKKRGVEFLLCTVASGIVPRKGVKTTPAAGQGASSGGGGPATDGFVAADMTLLCIGRRPSCDEAGLETVGVYTERGAIKTDARMRTNVPGIYAAGDVNGVSMLAHTAYREAEVAVNDMLGIKDLMSYDAIPSVIYTTPEIGCVGETEQSARAKGLDFIAKKLPMRYSGRYVAETAGTQGGDGICKLLMDRSSTRLLGAHVVGNYASEIIFAAAMMVESRWPLAALKKLVFPHPTVCEILRETLFEF